MIYTITLNPYIEKRIHGKNLDPLVYEMDAITYHAGGVGLRTSLFLKEEKIDSEACYVCGNNIAKYIKKDLLNVANELAEFFVPKNDINKTVIYRSITQHYQVVFQNTKSEDDKVLLPMVNWELYKTVSRTKMRHRVLYLALIVSPRMFRRILKHM